MTKLDTVREAKEFLVGRIVAEAKQEGIPLSDVERKMLYFSETDWTLPDMLKVNEEFERDYDQDEYEAKIAGLIRSFWLRTQADNEEELEAWTKAEDKLREGDHYLLVMINATTPTGGRLSRWLPSFDSTLPREPGDRLRLVLTALAILFGMFALRALLDWAFGPNWNHFER
jgi:hypothetical protein